MELRAMLLGDDERERIAYHESGHAVMAVRGGLGLRYARLTPTPEVITNMRLKRVPWPCVAARVKFHVGGYAADRRYTPTLASRGNSEYDFTQALALVDEDHLRILLRDAEREISQHWREVEAVARAPLQHERLEALEIYKIIVRAR